MLFVENAVILAIYGKNSRFGAPLAKIIGQRVPTGCNLNSCQAVSGARFFASLAAIMLTGSIDSPTGRG